MSKEKEILVRLCKEIEDLSQKVKSNNEGIHHMINAFETQAVDIDTLKRNVTLLENTVHELRLEQGVKNDLEDS